MNPSLRHALRFSCISTGLSVVLRWFGRGAICVNSIFMLAGNHPLRGMVGLFHGIPFDLCTLPFLPRRSSCWILGDSWLDVWGRHGSNRRIEAFDEGSIAFGIRNWCSIVLANAG